MSFGVCACIGLLPPGVNAVEIHARVSKDGPFTGKGLPRLAMVLVCTLPQIGLRTTRSLVAIILCAVGVTLVGDDVRKVTKERDKKQNRSAKQATTIQ